MSSLPPYVCMLGLVYQTRFLPEVRNLGHYESNPNFPRNLDQHERPKVLKSWVNYFRDRLEPPASPSRDDDPFLPGFRKYFVDPFPHVVRPLLNQEIGQPRRPPCGFRIQCLYIVVEFCQGGDVVVEQCSLRLGL